MPKRTVDVSKVSENPIDYLKFSDLIEFKAGGRIYEAHFPADKLYMVVHGKVSVVRKTSDEHEVVIDIYKEGEFFGEAIFLGLPMRGEYAVALGPVSLAVWPILEIFEATALRPKLALSFIKLLAKRQLNLSNRIESFSRDRVVDRFAMALMHFSQRLGTLEKDGSVHMPVLTHRLISQYVGTTRAFTANFMIQFRQQGYITYSPEEIVVYPERLQEWRKRWPKRTKRKKEI